MAADPARYPMIAEINAFFESEARSIQQGGSEYVFSKEYLNIYWPADEFIFVKLTAEGKFDAFYAEAGRLLAETVTARHARPADGRDRRGDPAQPRAGAPAFRQDEPHGRRCATTCSTTGTRCATASRRCCARRRCWSRSTAPASPTTTSRSGAARSSGGATRRAPISIRRPRAEITPELAGHY